MINNKMSWNALMESRTEIRDKMKTPTLVAIVVGLHVAAVGSVMFIQGCGTAQPSRVEAPPPPMMPPRDVAEPRPVPPPPPRAIQPPVPVAPGPSAEPHTYTVQPGDILSRIASRHGVSTAELIDLNKIKNPDTIRVGQKLLIPAHGKPVTPAAPAPAAPKPSAPAAALKPAEGATYVVQAGDSLTRIASRHGTSVQALRQANNLTGDKILVGQKLVIPGAKPAAAAPADRAAPTPPAAPRPAPETAPAPAPVPPLAAPQPDLVPADATFPYKVRANDTLDSIAQDFAVLKEDIIRLNNLQADQPLRPGQTLMIPPMSH